MTPGALAILAAVVLILTSKIPRPLLAVLIIAWLIAYNYASPGTITGALGEAWRLIGDTWETLPRTRQ